MSLWLSRRLDVLPEREALKKFHGRRPVRRNSAKSGMAPPKRSILVKTVFGFSLHRPDEVVDDHAEERFQEEPGKTKYRPLVSYLEILGNKALHKKSEPSEAPPAIGRHHCPFPRTSSPHP